MKCPSRPQVAPWWAPFPDCWAVNVWDFCCWFCLALLSLWLLLLCGHKPHDTFTLTNCLRHIRSMHEMVLDACGCTDSAYSFTPLPPFLLPPSFPFLLFLPQLYFLSNLFSFYIPYDMCLPGSGALGSFAARFLPLYVALVVCPIVWLVWVWLSNTSRYCARWYGVVAMVRGMWCFIAFRCGSRWQQHAIVQHCL